MSLRQPTPSDRKAGECVAATYENLHEAILNPLRVPVRHSLPRTSTAAAGLGSNYLEYLATGLRRLGELRTARAA